LHEKEEAIAEISLKKKEKSKSQAQYLEISQRYLSTYHQQCPYCLWKANRDSYHPFQKCRFASKSLKDKFYNLSYTLRHGKYIQGYLTCTFCFLPRVLCQKWQLDDQNTLRQSKKDCSYPDFLVSTLVVGLEIDSFQELLGRNMRDKDFQLGDTQVEAQYLGQVTKWEEIDYNFLFLEFNNARVQIELDREIREELEEERRYKDI
jgi:hypothetical protein